MKKMIKVRLHDRITKKFWQDMYTVEEDGEYPLNNDGSVTFSYLEDEDLFSTPLRTPYCQNEDDIDDIIEIDGKFGIYDWNMKLIGKLYDRIEDVPGMDE